MRSRHNFGGVLTAIGLIAGGLHPALGQAKHAFSLEDWAALPTAAPKAVSPDGNWILYSVMHGASKGPFVFELRLMHPDGSGNRRIELPDNFDLRGFTVDGRLFGSFRAKSGPEIAVFSLSSLGKDGTPEVEIKLPAGAQNATVSPDGRRLALTLDPRPADPLAAVHTVVRADESSLYVVNMDGTDGGWWQKQLKNVGQIVWSPDSSRVAAVSTNPKIGFHSIKSTIDVCTESAATRVTTIDNSVGSLVWTEGGKSLAFLTTTSATLNPDHIWTVPTKGGRPIDLTPKFNGSVMGLTADGHGAIWALVEHGVRDEIDLFANGRLTRKYAWPDGSFGNLPVLSPYSSATEQLVMGATDPTHCGNLVVPDGGNLRRLTYEGDDHLGQIDLGPVQVAHWTTKDGAQIEGIVTFPAGYVAGRKYPCVIHPHGGPEINDMLRFAGFTRLLSGAGYVVIEPQYRGSTGYGTEFLDAIYQHFGDRACRDVDSAADFAIAQGWADPNRLAIFGWSEGGAITAWTVTQTGRYKAAVDGAGITDWASFIWTSDNPQIDFDARLPAKFPDAFHKFSPIDFVDKVTTPTLILHGANDTRVPTYQAQEFFEALLAYGKTVRMVTYPGSGHFPMVWEQRIDVMRETLAWLTKYDPVN